MPAACEGTNFISLDAKASNFTIRQGYFMFSQENISLKTNLLSTITSTKNKNHPEIASDIAIKQKSQLWYFIAI